MIKLYRCDNGHLYKLHDKSCLFCSHCTDVFYDYSNGPYMAFCELNIEDSSDGNLEELCEHFKEDPEDPDIIYVEE